MFSPTRCALLLLLLLTGLRLVYAGRVELSPDEAYYQMWSERLDWSYYSKGPGVALAIRAGTSFFGKNEFGVRCLAPVLALGTSLLLWTLARRLYGAATAIWTVALLNLCPLFQAGALLMTIDPLSVFFWTAAMLTFWVALEKRRGGALPFWILTGLGVAAGFLCKYTNAMQIPGIVLALALVPRWRREFGRPGFYVMLGTALLGCLPPILWNSTHAWITLDHLRERGKLDAAFTSPLAEAAHFWEAQFGVYSPLLYLGLLVALGAACWRAGRRPEAPTPEVERTRFLLAFCLPLLVMYGLLAFKTKGEPNWTAPAILSLSVLGAAFWQTRARTNRVAGVFCVAAVAVALAMSVALLDTDLLRPHLMPLDYQRDPTARLLGWRSTAAAVATARDDEERELGAPLFLIANRYQLAAELNFYLPDKAPPGAAEGSPLVYLPESQNIENQFSLWPGYDQVAAPARPRRCCWRHTRATHRPGGIQEHRIQPVFGSQRPLCHRRRAPSQAAAVVAERFRGVPAGGAIRGPPPGTAAAAPAGLRVFQLQGAGPLTDPVSPMPAGLAAFRGGSTLQRGGERTDPAKRTRRRAGGRGLRNSLCR